MSAEGEGREGGSEQRTESLQKLEVPPHIKPDVGSLSSGSLSDTESYSDGYRSVPSGLELSELDVEGCVQEVVCAPVTWQKLIVEDLNLIPEELEDQEARASLNRKDVCKEKELYQSTKKKSAKLWGKLSWYVILFFIAGSAFIFMARGHLSQMLNWLEHLPWLESIIVFVVLFTIVCLPFGFGYIILNVMAGYLYGLVRGQVVVMVAVGVGVSVSFLLCRSWFRDYAKDLVTSSALRAVMRVVEGKNGIKVIMLTRLTPIPVGLQNTLFAVSDGLSSVPITGHSSALVIELWSVTLL